MTKTGYEYNNITHFWKGIQNKYPKYLKALKFLGNFYQTLHVLDKSREKPPNCKTITLYVQTVEPIMNSFAFFGKQ